jgi:hypothetical protein
MKARLGPSLGSILLIAIAALSCGGNHSSDQAAATAPAPPSSAPATAAPAEQTQPTPPPAAPAVEPPARPTPKPSRKHDLTADLKPQPPPSPKPQPVVVTVPTGTDLDVALFVGASSKTSAVGDAVRARVTKAVVVDGVIVVPEGTIVDGTVTEAIPSKKIGGVASLGLRFDAIELPGGEKAEIAAGLHEQGKSETGKDAGTIAGATAGGALLGRLLSKHDKTKGTLIGAVVGAAAGTGAAAATKGQEVELPAGTTLALHLEQPLPITVMR